MKLFNYIKIISPYKAKSKFAFWTNLKPEDIVLIYMHLKNPGSTRRGVYTTDIYFQNITTLEKFNCSLTQAENYLKNIDNVEYNFQESEPLNNMQY